MSSETRFAMPVYRPKGALPVSAVAGPLVGGRAGFTPREGVKNQVLQQSEHLNGVDQTVSVVHGIRDSTHVQRGFYEAGQ